MGKGGGITICTDSYTLAEVNILRQALQIKYNLNTSIHTKNKKYYRIYLKKDNNLKSFLKDLDPYILDQFKYKIDLTGNNKMNYYD